MPDLQTYQRQKAMVLPVWCLGYRGRNNHSAFEENHKTSTSLNADYGKELRQGGDSAHPFGLQTQVIGRTGKMQGNLQTLRILCGRKQIGAAMLKVRLLHIAGNFVGNKKMPIKEVVK
jgi:hypothetical protein